MAGGRSPRRKGDGIERELGEREGIVMLGERPMRALGIDLGINGGIAIIEIVDVPTVIDAIDVPVIGTGAKERVDVIAIHKWCELHQP